MMTPEPSSTGRVDPGSAGNNGSSRDTEELKATAQDLAQKASAQGKAQVDTVREHAAGSLEKLADGVREAASEWQQDDFNKVSEVISNLADGMAKFSRSLREKSGDDMLADISRLARENPALFIAGGAALGLGLARFMRAAKAPAAEDEDVTADQTNAESTQRSMQSASAQQSDSYTDILGGDDFTGSDITGANMGGASLGGTGATGDSTGVYVTPTSEGLTATGRTGGMNS